MHDRRYCFIGYYRLSLTSSTSSTHCQHSAITTFRLIGLCLCVWLVIYFGYCTFRWAAHEHWTTLLNLYIFFWVNKKRIENKQVQLCCTFQYKYKWQRMCLLLGPSARSTIVLPHCVLHCVYTTNTKSNLHYSVHFVVLSIVRHAHKCTVQKKHRQSATAQPSFIWNCWIQRTRFYMFHMDCDLIYFHLQHAQLHLRMW